MYKQFYGFNKSPFNTTPDTRFFYPSPIHEEALASLLYVINERKGFALLTGEIGAGKTTLCRTLLNKLDPSTKTAVITNTHLTAKGLLEDICKEYEIESRGSKGRLLDRLNAFLIDQLAQNNNVVLIVDEAQKLNESSLEVLRVLLNYETNEYKLLQLVLLGQSELHEKIVNIPNFFDRISLKCTLNPLSFKETEEMIDFRIRKAGYKSRMHLFLKESIFEIHQATQGYPRRITMLCHKALKSLVMSNKSVVSTDVSRKLIKMKCGLDGTGKTLNS